jgi:glycosyltransferase involved in cell wall biosynthesis
MASVIIPAYNEETVILETLSKLKSQDFEGRLEVIVACNGCSDNTANVARSVGGVRVLETSEAGKPIALNMGDSAATMFPRIYLDADVSVSKNFVRDITNSLNDDTRCVAWPQVRFIEANASASVKAFYKVWTRMPYNVPGRIGVGAYALNEKGRSAFEKFPDIISDDGFIRGLFSDSKQRVVVDSCFTEVKIPGNIRSLVAIKTRARVGAYELRKKYPNVSRALDASEVGLTENKIGALIKTRSGIHGILVYLIVNAWTRTTAAYRHRIGDLTWERDDSTRGVTQ